MNSSIVLHGNFDVSKVSFSPAPAKTTKGNKIVYVNFDDGHRARIQTPVMSAPFGVSTYDEASTGSKSYTLDGSFKGYEDNPHLASFLTKCRDLDERLIDEATKNSKEWFGKSSSREFVSELCRKLVRESSDPTKYAPTIRMKFATNMDGTCATQIFDEERNLVDMDYLVRGTTFKAIVELSSVWFVQKSFGITLRISQIAVVSRPAGAAMTQDKLTDFSFVDGEDDMLE